ncbi:MAG: molybdenum cofactor guanylyltransferase [Myxococcales bacterium]|nr:molybdenum cofactor guanylyltransferase [Myxococcales bacterium]
MALETPENAALGAIILAGGRSRRMGAPKAWIDWGGRPLLLHVLAQVRAVCRGAAVVVGARDVTLPPLPPGVARVDDPPSDDRGGPLIAILAGLRAVDDMNSRSGDTRTELVYLGACDGALLDAAHVRFVTGALARDPSRAAAVPRDPPDERGRRFLHPLASAVRVAPALAAAEAIVRAGGRRPAQLFEQLSTRYLDARALPSPEALRACNTPEELADARARATHDEARDT